MALLSDAPYNIRRGDVVFNVNESPYGHAGLALRDVTEYTNDKSVLAAHVTIECGVQREDWGNEGCCSLDNCGTRSDIELPLRVQLVKIAQSVILNTPRLLAEKRCGYNLEPSVGSVTGTFDNPNSVFIPEYHFSCSTFVAWCYRQLSSDGRWMLIDESSCPEIDQSSLSKFYRIFNLDLVPPGPIRVLFTGYLMRAFYINTYPFSAGVDAKDWEPWQRVSMYRKA